MTPTSRPGLEIRDLRREDVRSVVRIEAARHPVDAWSSTAFHEALDRPERYVCLVASTGAEESRDLHDQRREGVVGRGGEGVVAYGVVSIAGDIADLDNLTVRGDHERLGIGRWLLAALLGQAAGRNAHEVVLEVRADNAPAIGLYTAEGFLEIGRRRAYYASGLDAIVMRRDLQGPGTTLPPVADEAAYG